MKTKSFTLIELLVVIVIIGILAGVIIVSTSSSINKANFAKAQAFSNTVQQELLLNLVSEWTFDEDLVGIAKDTWGNNDGIVSGASYVPKSENRCVYGGCYEFNGIDDYINLGQNVINFNNNSFTFSTWTYFRSFTNHGSVYNCVAGMGNSTEYGWGILVNSSKNSFLVSTAKTATTLNTSNLINNWHHIVVVRDVASNKMEAYLDGTSPYVRTTTEEITEDSNFYLGRDGLSSRSGDQIIDETRIYNIVLSTSQIKQEYIAGLNSLLASNNISKEEYDQRLNSLAQK